MNAVGLLRCAAVATVVAASGAGVALPAWATGEAGGSGGGPTAAAEAPSWDQAASIRAAAERIGRLHRARGASAAYELVENCYKTHSLASAYGEGFEACIVQDYLETSTLIRVYSRMSPEALQKAGVPSPRQLADSMGQRISMAFGQYQKPQAYADRLKALVDEHGLPVFLSIVFPEAAGAIEQKRSKKKSDPR